MTSTAITPPTLVLKDHDLTLLGLPTAIRLRILEYVIAGFRFDTSKLNTNHYYCPPILVTCRQIRLEASELYIGFLSSETQRARTEVYEVYTRVKANVRSLQLGQQGHQAASEHHELLSSECLAKDEECNKVAEMARKEMSLLDEERLQLLGIKKLSKRKVETEKAPKQASKTAKKKAHKGGRERRRS